MKHLKIKITIVAFLMLIIVTFVFVLATDSPLEKNENGQTYGSVSGRSIEDVPDLVAARGIDGITVGYVKSTDLFSPLPSSPEEAVKMQLEKDARGLYTIPLYESDGKTVIGEFLMGNGSPEEVEAFINSRLNKN